MSGLGNGQGWNDGSYYTGYLTLNFEDTDYRAICIDALHPTAGYSWDGMYIPITDFTTTGTALGVYFGITDAAVYLPKLYADMAGYAMLNGIGPDRAANNDIQHAVWAQFDSAHYTDSGLLSAFAQSHPPVDPEQFGLIVDADYLHSAHPEQMFLVNMQPPSHQTYFVDIPGSPAPEPGSGMLVGIAFVGIGIALRRAGRKAEAGSRVR